MKIARRWSVHIGLQLASPTIGVLRRLLANPTLINEPRAGPFPIEMPHGTSRGEAYPIHGLDLGAEWDETATTIELLL